MKKRFSKEIILIGVVVFLLACVSFIFSMPPQAQAGTTTIAGKIINIHYGVWKPFVGRNAQLVIKGPKGKIFNVYTGAKTVWVPHRTPVIGDRVSCQCVKGVSGMYAGKWQATSVNYK